MLNTEEDTFSISKKVQKMVDAYNVFDPENEKGKF